MKLLICTSIPISSPSAAKNRLDRLRQSLAPHGIESILVGAGGEHDESWRHECTANGPSITYNPQKISARGHCRAMTIGAKAARFYSDYLMELIKGYECTGVIAFVSQAQVDQAILKAARSSGVLVVADVVERFGLSLHYFLDGMNYQQIKLCRSVLPRMDGLIGISKGWCDWATRRGIPNVWIPSFAQDQNCVRTGASPTGGPFTIAFIGHWVPRELPKVFLRAMKLCLNQGIEVRMNVLGNVGNTYRERPPIRMLKKDATLREVVRFLGFVSDEERDRLLANSDAFIILRPDNRETDMLFPTRLPEYLLSGNPVILSKAGSFPHCFEHRKNVWFVSPRNTAEDVADAIIHLAKHPHERLAIGARGRQTALEQFSPDVLGRRLADFLKQVAHRHSRE